MSDYDYLFVCACSDYMSTPPGQIAQDAPVLSSVPAKIPNPNYQNNFPSHNQSPTILITFAKWIKTSYGSHVKAMKAYMK